jgi:anti-anti-sigma regulatory factor
MSTVELGGDLGIESSTELKNRLCPAGGAGRRADPDASQVARIHTAAVQVLCAFVQARREAGLAPASTVAPQPSVTPRACWASPRPSAWT